MKKKDEMVKIIDISAWIALLTIFAVIAGALTWGFFGTMLLREDTTGVMVKSGRIINIYAASDYRLLDLNVKSSEYVDMGQVIVRADWPELVNEINQMIARNAAANEINVKRAKLIEESQIVAPEAGRIVDVFVNSGDFVRRGDKIATISKEAPDGRAVECYLFVPANQIKNIRKNMNVNIYPANVNKKLYGNMTGIVTKISEFPVTENHMFNLLGSRELAQEFLKEGACYEVYINLVTSEETVTGYAWTTSFGPQKRFGNITLCDASVVLEKVRPIDLFFKR
jgi:multidrug resistance efflux pump